jgi:hypothetical protein
MHLCKRPCHMAVAAASAISLLAWIHTSVAQVEIKTKPDTPNADMLQKAADFVHAYILGGCS